MREEIGLRKSHKGRMVEKRLKWAGRVERMAEDRLTKTADAYREEGRMRGRPRLRWEDCVKRYVREAGIEGNWRGKSHDSKEWIN